MNNKEKFEILFNQSKSKLYAVAYSVSHNREQAEDILQDAYVKAWKKFSEYDSNKKFENWMTTIVKNTAIDNSRHKSKKINTVSFESKPNHANNSYVMNIEDKNSNLFENYNKKLFLTQLHSAICDLPGDLKNIMLPLAEGYSYAEISEQINIPISTVRARVHRAKQIIRKNTKFATF